MYLKNKRKKEKEKKKKKLHTLARQEFNELWYSVDRESAYFIYIHVYAHATLESLPNPN